MIHFVRRFVLGFTAAAAGNYAVSLKAAQRAYYSNQSIQVLIDNVVVSTFTNLPINYTPLTTATFALTVGQHTIKIRGLNAVGDGTDFIDDVKVVAQ